ncbi:right-handed parallel beta-helix repeat-containing protein [bacterium]|nr:right-handed parallel beta-helix repeat-containing protein [bacterium]
MKMLGKWLGCAIFALCMSSAMAQRLPASDVYVTTTSGAVDRRPMAPPVVYVAADGSGDFNIDGKDDQVEINAALKFIAEHHNEGYTTVRLQGRLVYWLSAPVRIGSNTILTGDGHVCLRVIDHANWARNEPIVGTIETTGTHDVEIFGFEIDGNDENNSDLDPRTGRVRNLGQYYYTGLEFTGAGNINVHHMFLHNNMNDMFKVTRCQNVKYHDNIVYKTGHAGIYAVNCQNVEVFRNNITNRTSSAIRPDSVNHLKIWGNIVTSLSGSGGVQIQKSNANPMDDIEIYNTVFYETNGSAVNTTVRGGAGNDKNARDLHIHHNIIYDTGYLKGPNYGGGGVSISGFHDTVIENNVFDGNCDSAIAHPAVRNAKTSGTAQFVTIVRNNIISNTRAKRSPGVAMRCDPSGTYMFKSERNCFFKNEGGNFSDMRGVISKHDLIEVDPLYVSRADRIYQLKSKEGRWDGAKWVRDDATSPCVGAGRIDGARIDIGAYGYPPMKKKLFGVLGAGI